VLFSVDIRDVLTVSFVHGVGGLSEGWSHTFRMVHGTLGAVLLYWWDLHSMYCFVWAPVL